MEKRSAVSSVLLLGIFLLNLIFFSLLVTTILFLFGISISAVNLPLAAVLSAAVCFWFSGRSSSQTVVVAFVGVVLLAGAILICGRTYDWSWDGNAYHKAMVGMLKYGWNPLKESFYDFAERFDFLAMIEATWDDAYPKAPPIWGACVYAVTRNIETGKSFNLVSMMAAFLIGYGFLAETGVLRSWQSALCAFFCVFHPVALAQLLTYYDDGFLWQTLLICLIALLYLTFFEGGRLSKIAFHLIFLSINIGFNIKFSALIYFAVLCLAFYGYWVVKRLRRGEGALPSLLCGRAFFTFALSVLSGLLVTGATSYVTNTIRYHNPVYTMIGAGSTDIMTPQMPVIYQNISNPVRFICALFSRTNGDKYVEAVEWKIPFTFDQAEVSAAQIYDVRIGGWGILFSGIFLISLGVLLYALIRYRHTRSAGGRTAWQLAILLTLVAVGVICVVPGMFWGRYFVAPLYYPVAALLFLFVRANRSHAPAVIGHHLIAGILSVALLGNTVPNLLNIAEIFQEYDRITRQLEDFSALAEREGAVVGYSEYLFEGRFFTLYDMGIGNWRYGEIDTEKPSWRLFSGGDCYLLFQLLGVDTAEEFLAEITPKENQLILVALRDEGTEGLTPAVVDGMRALGLEFDMEGKYRCAYLGVVDGGSVLHEEVSAEKLTYSAEVGGSEISLVSAGYDMGDAASIQIDGKEYALNSRGLNIVTYDTQEKKVTHSVCIDSYLDNRLLYMPE